MQSQCQCPNPYVRTYVQTTTSETPFGPPCSCQQPVPHGNSYENSSGPFAPFIQSPMAELHMTIPRGQNQFDGIDYAARIPMACNNSPFQSMPKYVMHCPNQNGVYDTSEPITSLNNIIWVRCDRHPDQYPAFTYPARLVETGAQTTITFTPKSRISVNILKSAEEEERHDFGKASLPSIVKIPYSEAPLFKYSNEQMEYKLPLKHSDSKVELNDNPSGVSIFTVFFDRVPATKPLYNCDKETAEREKSPCGYSRDIKNYNAGPVYNIEESPVQRRCFKKYNPSLPNCISRHCYFCPNSAVYPTTAIPQCMQQKELMNSCYPWYEPQYCRPMYENIHALAICDQQRSLPMSMPCQQISTTIGPTNVYIPPLPQYVQRSTEEPKPTYDEKLTRNSEQDGTLVSAEKPKPTPTPTPRNTKTELPKEHYNEELTSDREKPIPMRGENEDNEKKPPSPRESQRAEIIDSPNTDEDVENDMGNVITYSIETFIDVMSGVQIGEPEVNQPDQKELTHSEDIPTLSKSAKESKKPTKPSEFKPIERRECRHNYRKPELKENEEYCKQRRKARECDKETEKPVVCKHIPRNYDHQNCRKPQCYANEEFCKQQALVGQCQQNVCLRGHQWCCRRGLKEGYQRDRQIQDATGNNNIKTSRGTNTSAPGAQDNSAYCKAQNLSKPMESVPDNATDELYEALKPHDEEHAVEYIRKSSNKGRSDLENDNHRPHRSLNDHKVKRKKQSIREPEKGKERESTRKSTRKRRTVSKNTIHLPHPIKHKESKIKPGQIGNPYSKKSIRKTSGEQRRSETDDITEEHEEYKIKRMEYTGRSAIQKRLDLKSGISFPRRVSVEQTDSETEDEIENYEDDYIRTREIRKRTRPAQSDENESKASVLEQGGSESEATIEKYEEDQSGSGTESTINESEEELSGWETEDKIEEYEKRRPTKNGQFGFGNNIPGVRRASGQQRETDTEYTTEDQEEEQESTIRPTQQGLARKGSNKAQRTWETGDEFEENEDDIKSLEPIIRHTKLGLFESEASEEQRGSETEDEFKEYENIKREDPTRNSSKQVQLGLKTDISAISIEESKDKLGESALQSETGQETSTEIVCMKEECRAPESFMHVLAKCSQNTTERDSLTEYTEKLCNTHSVELGKCGFFSQPFSCFCTCPYNFPCACRMCMPIFRCPYCCRVAPVFRYGVRCRCCIPPFSRCH